MPKVIMVQHINVQITNRQRTQEWYENVLGARFRDRGPERNKRQLQLHLGNAEMHEPLAKVHVACCIYERSPIKTEPHQRSHDIVGLPPQPSQGGSANEAQREGIMVDGDRTADVVAPS